MVPKLGWFSDSLGKLNNKLPSSLMPGLLSQTDSLRLRKSSRSLLVYWIASHVWGLRSKGDMIISTVISCNLASWPQFSQFSSVTQSCLTFCDPMDCSMPGLPVHHQLPEFTQTHVHWVSDAIQPSHPLSSPSPPAFNLSQHQDLFKWVHFFTSGGQSIGVSASASVLPMNIQDWFPLGWTGWVSLQSKGLSRVFNTTV